MQSESVPRYIRCSQRLSRATSGVVQVSLAALSLVDDDTLVAIGYDRNSPGHDETVKNVSEFTQKWNIGSIDHPESYSV